MELKAYIKKKFNNEVRKYYFEQENLREQKKSISYRISQTSYSTSQKPIYNFIEKFYDNAIENPILILKPKVGKEDLLKKYKGIEEDSGKVIENIIWEILDSQAPIAKLDLEEKTVYINSLHPYIANYSDSYKNSLPLENLVITEVLTEAYLYDIGLDEVIINSIMRMRDTSLRQLALSDRDGIPAVAMLLRDSVANPAGLEDAVYRAFLALGFETTKIGGNGKPDGYANAVLGHTAEGESKSYSLTYDAKSTDKKGIAAGTAKLSGLNRHKLDYNATYSVEVAIDYAGSNDPESAINKEAVQQEITVMRVQDLARLILYAAPKQLGLEKLRNLFDTCYTPSQVTEWVDRLVAEQPEQGPYLDIIEVVYQLQHDDDTAPTIEVVRMKVNEKLGGKYSVQKIKTYAEVLRTIIPGQFHFDDKYIHVDCSPELMKTHINNSINTDIPVTMREIYNAMFKVV